MGRKIGEKFAKNGGILWENLGKYYGKSGKLNASPSRKFFDLFESLENSAAIYFRFYFFLGQAFAKNGGGKC